MTGRPLVFEIWRSLVTALIFSISPFNSQLNIGISVYVRLELFTNLF